MNYDMNQVAEARIEALRQDAALRRCAAAQRSTRASVPTVIRTAVGRAMVRAGERLAAAPVRPAVTR